MTTVSEIQDAIRALSERGFKAFSSWFDQYKEERWDRQIESDQKAGPLRELMEKARSDFAADKCTDLGARAKRGSRRKFLKAMAKVPHRPPMPGDVLPVSFKRRSRAKARATSM